LLALTGPSDAARTFRAALLFVLLVLAAYSSPLFTRRNFGGRDLVSYNLPMEKSVHDAYSRGRLPLWSPNVSGGRPLLPNPNAGALYPVRAALAAVPFPLAMRLFPILHWTAAGIGTILLLRAIGASPAAAFVGAATFVFSGVSVSEAIFPHIQPGTALLPWILWALVRPAKATGTRVVLAGFLFGLAFLAGDVFTLGMAILAAVCWISVEAPRNERPGRFGILAAALLLGALFALPQIVATALWIPETNRAVLGLKLEDSFLYSIFPGRLFELLIPYPFGATHSLEDARIWGWPMFRFKPSGLFATLYAGAFAAIALVHRGSGAVGERFARTLFVVALLLAVAPSLLPRRWEDLPSPIALRNPEKFAVAMSFALAVAAGVAFDRFRRATPRRWTVAVAALLAVAAVAATLIPAAVGLAAVRSTGADPRLAGLAGDWLSGALAEAGLLWCLAIGALAILRRGTPAAAAAAVALVSLAPVVANRRIAQTFRQEEILAETAFARVLQRRDPAGSWRTLGESAYRRPSAFDRQITEWDPTYTEIPRHTWAEHTQALWGRGTVFNYDFDAGDLSRLETLRQVSRFAARHQRGEAFFGSLALKWGIRFRDQAPLPGYRRFGGDRIDDWDENASALPDLRLIESWRESPGGVPVLNAIGRVEPGEVIVETGRSRRGTAPAGELRVLEKSAERVELETRTLADTWLFVLRGYWPYRSVTIDGRPAAVVPAQLAFCAVAVPGGVHRIDWRERVPGGAISGWGPVAFGVVALVAVHRGRKTRRGGIEQP
jgi:hypothetical protein